MDKRKAILDSECAICQYKYFHTISTVKLPYKLPKGPKTMTAIYW